MLLAIAKSFGQLADPRIVRVLVRAVLYSIVLFGLLIGGVIALLRWSQLTEMSAFEWVADVLGSLVPFALALALFPAVAQIFLGLYLEEVADAVEDRHYQDLPDVAGIGFMAGIWATIRFLIKALLLNIALLALLLFPPVYPPAWLLCNAYLLGREYFELVAFRRLTATDARALRRRHRVDALLGGLLGMGLFSIPVVNFVAPVVLTMVMVHACQRWLRTEHIAP